MSSYLHSLFAVVVWLSADYVNDETGESQWEMPVQ
jgi:hypothetical protein